MQVDQEAVLAEYYLPVREPTSYPRSPRGKTWRAAFWDRSKTRVELQQGRVDTAPPGPFDGGTRLLMLYLLSTRRTAAQVAGDTPTDEPGCGARGGAPKLPAGRGAWSLVVEVCGIRQRVQHRFRASARVQRQARWQALVAVWQQRDGWARTSGFHPATSPSTGTVKASLCLDGSPSATRKSAWSICFSNRTRIMLTGRPRAIRNSCIRMSWRRRRGARARQ